MLGPVTHVDWQQASQYAAWKGGRLPTEAEWGKACRGTDARIYPWGDEAPTETLLNFYSNEGMVTDVGTYADGQSPYGLLDIAGNVWEWVNDRYDETYYQNSPSSNPLGPDTGQSRVLRGGAWDRRGSSVHSTIRNSYSPNNTYDNLGFRCAMNAEN